MKKNLIAAMAAAVFLTGAGVAAAAPAAQAAQGNFADVPASHWAYTAVAELARVGVIQGYSDSTFRGDKTISRYEMAEIVAKALDNAHKTDARHKALIDKLASEFAMELNKLTDRVAKLEKNQPALTLKGQYTAEYKIKETSAAGKAAGSYNVTEGKYRMRLEGKAKLDTYNSLDFRLADPAPTATRFRDSTTNKFGDVSDNALKLDRVSGTTKIGGVDITIGRQALVIDPENFIVDSPFFSYDGVKASWKAGEVQVDVRRGRFARGVTDVYAFNGQAKNDFKDLDINGVNVSGESGKGTWAAGWADFSNNRTATSNGKTKLMNYYFAAGEWAFTDKFVMGTEVGKNTAAVSGGKFWSVKGIYGSQKLKNRGDGNVMVQYIHVGQNTIATAYTAMDQIAEGCSDAFSVMDFSYSYALGKNVVGKVQRTFVTDKDNDKESYKFWKFKLTYKF